MLGCPEFFASRRVDADHVAVAARIKHDIFIHNKSRPEVECELLATCDGLRSREFSRFLINRVETFAIMKVHVTCIGGKSQRRNPSLLRPQLFARCRVESHHDARLFIPEELLIHFRLITDSPICRSVIRKLCFPLPNDNEQHAIRVKDFGGIRSFIRSQSFSRRRIQCDHGSIEVSVV